MAPRQHRSWANDNPFVQGGKCTDEGRRFLELTEECRIVRWEGLERTERVLTRKEWTDLWLKGEKWVDDWVTRMKKEALKGHGQRK